MIFINNVIILFYLYQAVSTTKYTSEFSNNSKKASLMSQDVSKITDEYVHNEFQEIHKLKCKEYIETYNAIPLPPVPEISGGTFVEYYELPHMISLGYLNDEDQLMHLCGGTLISEEFVLTAAHCVNSANRKFIKLARLEYSLRDYNISKIIIHPLYTSSSRYNDIALIKLNRKVTFSRSNIPACLSSGFGKSLSKLTVTGWGSTKAGGPHSKVLMKTDLYLYPQDDCNRNYYNNSKDRKLKNGIDNVTQICAWGDKYKTRDTCQGDSGGPLGIQTNDLFLVVGITSFGKVCGLGTPGVYTNISTYIPWIEENVWLSKNFTFSKLTNRNTDNKNREIYKLKCIEYTDIYREKLKTRTFSERNKNPLEEFQYSHVISLGYRNIEGNFTHLCGGTLISDKFVLTAAHCLHPLHKAFINIARLASKFLNDDDDYEISNFVVYPLYSPLLRYNDIALIQLNRKVTFSLDVIPACLHYGFHNSMLTKLTSTGWVKTQIENNYSHILMEIELFLYPQDACNNIFKNKGRKLLNGINNESQICAWSSQLRNSDTCNGDSGGAIGIKTIFLFGVVGITSFGENCGRGIPTVYTRILPYIPWIERNVWQTV